MWKEMKPKPNNNITECTPEIFYGLSAHWWNVAKTKLDLEDYKNHIYSSMTAAKLRCIAKFMEKNG
jgi:hypothetical protein